MSIKIITAALTPLLFTQSVLANVDCERGMHFTPETTEIAGERDFRGNRDFTLNLGKVFGFTAASLTVIGIGAPFARRNNYSYGYSRSSNREQFSEDLHHARRLVANADWYTNQELEVEMGCLEHLTNHIAPEEQDQYMCSSPARRSVRNGYRVYSHIQKKIWVSPLTLEEAREHCSNTL